MKGGRTYIGRENKKKRQEKKELRNKVRRDNHSQR